MTGNLRKGSKVEWQTPQGKAVGTVEPPTNPMRSNRAAGLEQTRSPDANLAATDLRPFVPAQDFELSQRFYARLGWETRVVAPNLALVTVSDRQSFYLQDYYVREVAENSMLHLTVSDAQAWYAHVVERIAGQPFGTARVHPPKWQDYGALVTFLHDPTGVLLHLCEWRDSPGSA